jgi:hypothetical protein
MTGFWSIRRSERGADSARRVVLSERLKYFLQRRRFRLADRHRKMVKALQAQVERWSPIRRVAAADQNRDETALGAPNTR